MSHYSRVKFLINEGSIHINDVEQSPLHVAVAAVLGMVDKKIVKEIILASDPRKMIKLAREQIGQAVLGGYCIKISEEPLIYKYERGSSSVPPADEVDFYQAQQSGNIIFHSITNTDVAQADIF